MNAWLETVGWWAVDYQLLAGLLLAAACAAVVCLRQPAHRVAVAWATSLGLLLLALLTALPGWPRAHWLPAQFEAELEIADAAAPPSAEPADPLAAPPREMAGPMEARFRQRAEFPPVRPAVELSDQPLPAVAPAAVEAEIEPPAPAVSMNWPLAAGALVVAAAALTGVWLLVGIVQTARLRRRGRPAPAELVELLDHVTLGARRRPLLLASGDVNQPLAMGVVRPAIVLPDEFVSREPACRVTAALAHEWAHIRHGDLWLLGLARLLLPLLALQPLFWWLRRAVRNAQEELADAAAASRGDRIEYAEVLLSWARTSPERVPRGMAGSLAFWERPSQLKLRVLRLLQGGLVELRCSRRRRLAIAAVTLASVALLSLQSLRPAAIAEAPSGDDEAAAPDDDVLTVSGQVVDPQGQPVDGASIFAVRWYWERHMPHAPLAQAKSGADGRFTISFRKSQFNVDLGQVDQWKNTGIVAVAEGLAPAWVTSRDIPAGAEPTLRLVADDVPITGRVVDLEGKPVAGVSVRVANVYTAKDGNLDAWLEAVRRGEFIWTAAEHLEDSLQAFDGWPAHVVTRGDGRFRIAGLGRDRRVELSFIGPTIAYCEAYVVTRASSTLRQRLGAYTDETRAVYGAEFELAAPPTRPIEGVVRDAETRQPLAGVAVESWKFADTNLGNVRVLRAVSDKNGRYRLMGMPKGKGNQLLAVPNDEQPYLMREVAVPEVPGVEAITANIELHRGVWITGRVTDRTTGKPVAARLHYYPFRSNEFAKNTPEFGTQFGGDGYQNRYTSGPDGTFRLVGLPGRAIVGADCIVRSYRGGVGAEAIEGMNDEGRFETYFNGGMPGKKSPHAMREINPPAGTESVVCNLELVPGETITVSVVTADGQPVSGFEVDGRAAADSYFGAAIETSSFDCINLGPDETRTMLIRHKERAVGKVVRLRLGDHPSRRAKVVLEPLAKVTGRLVDRDGAPLANAAIKAQVLPEEDFGKSLSPVTADDEGRFEYTDIPTGCDYTFYVEGGEIRYGWLSDELSLAPGEVRNLADVTATQQPRAVKKTAAPAEPMSDGPKQGIQTANERNAIISGRIVDLEGRPVAGASAQILSVWSAVDDDGGKLDRWLEALRAVHDSSEFRDAQLEHLKEVPLDKEAGQRPPVLTDAEGRFMLDAGGEQRVVHFRVDGSGIESVISWAVTRPLEPLRIRGQLPTIAAAIPQAVDDFVVYGAAFERAVAPDCRVEGTVRDEQTGEPLSGVVVRAERAIGWTFWTYGSPFRTTTDDDGHYALSGISARTQATRIVALAGSERPYISKTLDAALNKPGQRATVDFDLGRGVWVEGRVIDKPTGRGLEAYVVYHTWYDSPYLKRAGKWLLYESTRRKTDADGSFRILALPGRGLISASAGDSYAEGIGLDALGAPADEIVGRAQPNLRDFNTVVPIDAPEGDATVGDVTVRCNVELEPGRKRSGTVVGPDGQPLEGAVLVFGWKNNNFYGETPLEGPRFTIEQLVPGRPRTLLFLHKSRKLIGTAETSGDGDEPLVVPMQPWAGVRGRVVDFAGKPCSGVQISTSSPWFNRTHTDADGRFSIEALLPRAKLRLSTVVSNVHLPLGASLSLDPGETRELGDLVAEDPLERDKPSDKKPPAEHDTKTADEKAPPQAAENAGAAAAPPKTFVVQGQVIDQQGKPLAGADVRVFRSYLENGNRYADSELLVATRSGEDGRFSVDAPAQGERWASNFSFLLPYYMAVATAPGRGADWEWVGPMDKVRQIELRLVPDSVHVEGRLLDLEGRPLEGVQVTVQGICVPQDNLDDWLTSARANPAPAKREQPVPPQLPGGKVLEIGGAFPAAVSDAAGRFTLEGIGTDRLVELELRGAMIASTRMRLITRRMPPLPLSDDDPRFRVQLCVGATFDVTLEPSQPIVGHVRDGDTGRPLAGVSVELENYPGSFQAVPGFLRAVSDDAGEFHLAGVAKLGSQREKISLRVWPGANEPYFRDEVEVPLKDGLAAVTCDVELKRAIWVEGRVSDLGSGRAVPSLVAYYPMRGNAAAVNYPSYRPGGQTLGHDDRYATDADGQFRIPALPGRGIVVALAREAERYPLGEGAEAIDGLVQKNGEWNVYEFLNGGDLINAVREIHPAEDAEGCRCDIRLAALSVTRLDLVDADGKPLTGVSTTGLTPRRDAGFGYYNGPSEELAGSSTEILGPATDELRCVLFAHRGRNLGAAVWFTPDTVRGKKSLQVVLRPCGSITGRAVDRNRAPLAGVHVTATIEPVDSPTGLRQDLERRLYAAAATGPDGRFRIEHVPPGARYALEISMKKIDLAPLALEEPGRTIDVGDVGEERPRP